MSGIETPRLILRELNFEDAPFILELLNEAGFLRHIGDKGVRNLADAREYMLKGPMDSYARNGFGLYATCLHDGTPTGICGLVKRAGLECPDVGFAFLERFWSRGYAVESAAAVMEHARAVLNLEHVVAITSPDNSKSIGVLEKIGFQFARTIRLADHTPELRLYELTHAESRQ